MKMLKFIVECHILLKLIELMFVEGLCNAQQA